MPPNPRLLLVKLSSLGDVIHNLPVATDIRRAMPDAQIEWAVEAPYAELVRCHPALTSVLPIHLRELKRNWYRLSAWRQILADRAALRARPFDAILDTQGLIKSAWVASWAQGPIVGYDRASIREPAASRWYQQRFSISRELHAVERNRSLAAAALGYTHTSECDYGLPHEWPQPTSMPSGFRAPYVVCLTASSRVDKCWSQAAWIALGQMINAAGTHVVLPSGSAAEAAQSQAIAAALTSATALEPRSLVETAAVLSHARAIVGVDTGLSHLAVALKRPTVGLYLSTLPARTGLYGQLARNLGGGTRDKPAVISPDAALGGMLDVIERAERV